MTAASAKSSMHWQSVTIVSPAPGRASRRGAGVVIVDGRRRVEGDIAFLVGDVRRGVVDVHHRLARLLAAPDIPAVHVARRIRAAPRRPRRTRQIVIVVGHRRGIVLGRLLYGRYALLYGREVVSARRAGIGPRLRPPLLAVVLGAALAAEAGDAHAGRCSGDGTNVGREVDGAGACAEAVIGKVGGVKIPGRACRDGHAAPFSGDPSAARGGNALEVHPSRVAAILGGHGYSRIVGVSVRVSSRSRDALPSCTSSSCRPRLYLSFPTLERRA